MASPTTPAVGRTYFGVGVAAVVVAAVVAIGVSVVVKVPERGISIWVSGAAAAATAEGEGEGESSSPSGSGSGSSGVGSDGPTAWPHEFHSLLVQNYSGELTMIDLWYEWPKGRNMNILRPQLGDVLLYDIEWNNGTSFFYYAPHNTTCRTVHLEVGILRPDWLAGARFLGRRTVDGFLCNIWEKADFIWYYEDVLTRRPVHWRFYTGRAVHVMTFEVGAVLEDAKWQAPVYCFTPSPTPTLPSVPHSQSTTRLIRSIPDVPQGTA